MVQKLALFALKIMGLEIDTCYPRSAYRLKPDLRTRGWTLWRRHARLPKTQEWLWLWRCSTSCDKINLAFLGQFEQTTVGDGQSENQFESCIFQSSPFLKLILQSYFFWKGNSSSRYFKGQKHSLFHFEVSVPCLSVLHFECTCFLHWPTCTTISLCRLFVSTYCPLIDRDLH